MLLRSREQDGPQIWCRCDGGPHGFGAIAGHAHADALSIEVRHHGVDILADPGTYCYHGEGEWRQYFRSTSAHNTLALDGTDSSRSGGPFLWTRHATTVTTGCDTGDQPVQTWSAQHDGYRVLSTPLTHHRQVSLDSPERLLSVVDTVVAEPPSDPTTKPTTRPRKVPAERVAVQLTWQLGPLVEAELDGASAVLRWSGGSAELHLPDALTWTTHRGEQNPIRGWYSPAFGVRVPATVLIGTGTCPDTQRLVTELRFVDQADGGST